MEVRLLIMITLKIAQPLFNKQIKQVYDYGSIENWNYFV
jgi:hypothetical protein